MAQVQELARVPEMREKVNGSIEAYEKETGHSLSEDVKSDIRLARFLNAYDGDLDAAAAAYCKMLEWRKKVEVEKLRAELFPDLEELRQSAFPHWEAFREVGDFGPWYHAGESHKGDLVHLEVLGRLDPSLLLERVSEEKILQHQIGFFEARAKLLDSLSEESGRLVRTIQVRDLSKFGLHLLQHAKALSVVSSVMKAGTHNFPESTSKSIFICTPTSFYAIWHTLSGMLRKKTQEKVMFLKEDYHRELLKYVDAKAIHRLEKMKAIENHEFIEKGEQEDHLPLEYQKELSVAAGKKAYYPIWLTRTGPRSKVKLCVSPAQGSQSSEPPPMKLSFVASQLQEGKELADVIDVNLSPEAYVVQGVQAEWLVPFPEQMPEEISSGFLLVEFDNSSSWVYSIVVPIKATFS